ncbi:MAG: reactive intermediate/imine deaminase [Armatimonadota bacterium]
MPREAINAPDGPPAVGPYSHAAKGGGLLFLSGQIPLRADGTMVTGDVRDQARQVMDNLEKVLRASNASWDDVLKCTIFLTSMDHFAAVNEVYGERFPTNPPARATFAVAGLPRGADVEIEAIAAI